MQRKYKKKTVNKKRVNTWHNISIHASYFIKSTGKSLDYELERTMAMSWELFAWAMPKILVVCITSTEKLGSQLAMRDPVEQCTDIL